MKRLTIGLGTAAIIFILLGTVACGGGDGALAKGGINMIVVSGQARIRSGEENTLVVEGQEAVLTAGDQVMAADEAGVKLLLADGSLLYLNPDTDLRVVTFSAEGTARLSQLKGKLEVETASPLLTVEISTSVYEGFAQKTMQFTATPAVRDTTFQLWIDGVNAHLTVEAGEVNVTNNGRTATIYAGSEVIATTDGGLALVEPTTTAVPTADLTPTITPDLTHPSPTATATPTVAPQKHPPPGLSGPDDGSEFKGDETILLIWNTPTTLAENEWYEVQLRKEEEPFEVVQWVKEGTWQVEDKYYPGRYQWRIRIIVRGQEGHKEMDLSPLSQTWSFSWLSPPVQTPTATPTSTPSDVSVDLTVYLRGTRTQPDFAALSDDQDGWEIYEEGQCVYGDAAVQIGETTYHFYKPGVAEQLPDPWEVKFEFAKELEGHTRNEDGCAEKGAGFDPKKAWFWVGILDDNSAMGEDKPYSLTMKLYEETNCGRASKSSSR